MSLKDARRVARRAHNAGLIVTIRGDRAACLARNPKLHRMAGDCVVVTDTGRFLWLDSLK